MRNNHYAYAKKLRAKVLKLLLKKLYNLPMVILRKLYKGFPVIFPDKYLKNNT